MDGNESAAALDRGAEGWRTVTGSETDAPSSGGNGMFRPGHPRFSLGYVPVRLALSAFALLGVLLAAAVAVGIQYERHRLLTAGPPAAGSSSFIRGLSRPELVAAFAVLLLAAIGLVLFG